MRAIRDSAEGDLDDAADDDGSGDEAPVAELLDEPEDDGRQTGGRTCNLKRRAGDQAGDEAADDAGDETGHDGGARGQRDAERQRDGDEEHDQRREDVLASRGEGSRTGRLGRGGRYSVGHGHRTRLLCGQSPYCDVTEVIGFAVMFR